MEDKKDITPSGSKDVGAGADAGVEAGVEAGAGAGADAGARAGESTDGNASGSGRGIEVGSGSGIGSGNRRPSAERRPSLSPSAANTATSTTPLPPRPPSSGSTQAVHRFPSMPGQSRASGSSSSAEAHTRPRGRSLNQPRTELTHSTTIISAKKGGQEEEDRMRPIPESRAVSPTAAERNFVSPGMRRRTTTMRTTSSLQRNGTQSSRRRPSINMGSTTGVAGGGDPDAVNFSLAGAPVVQEVAPLNQPYVDPGYTELNPAYEQPVNSRPVWGLAKPLPRVLRPGMVPTRSELNIDTAADNQKPAADEDVDLEQGRVDQTFNLRRISSQLQQTRRRRENNLAQAYGSVSPSSPSGLGRQNSEQIVPFPDLTEEEEGMTKYDSHSSVQGGDQAQTNDYPDDAASAVTEKAEEGDLDGDWIGEEIPLKAYDPQEDEIHNLHTHWSVIRVRFREPLAELLAVTVQLTLGFCSDLVVTCAKSTAGNEETTDWAWGLATMVGIYIAGGISGAHLNPAISIMLWIFRGFPLRKVPGYVFAQVLGAFLAALIAFGIYKEGIIDYGGKDLGNGGTMSAFLTYPRHDYIQSGTAFATEFTGSAILGIAVLAMGDDANAPPGAGMSAFVMGLTITVISMAFGYNTGAALNPSRDFGPRLALLALGYGRSIFTNAYWFYGPWVATITGAIFGAFLYDAAIFVGGESPVNYPRRRMKRAAVKWRKKWGGRIKRRVIRPRPAKKTGPVGTGDEEVEFVSGQKVVR